MCKKSELFFLFVLIGSIVVAQNAISQQLDIFKNDKDLQQASIGFYAYNSSTKSVLVDYNSQISLVPASTLKVITTAAALGILGPSFVYKTTIEYDGTLDSLTGILNGNLYVKGNGDPTLESEYFKTKKDTLLVMQRWAQHVKANGIKKITGSIIADESLYSVETIPSTWIWGDIGNYYGPTINALPYSDNKIKILFDSPTNVGDTCKIVRLLPEQKNLQIENYVIAGGSSDNAYVYSYPGSNKFVITGTIPPAQKKYEVGAAMPNPGLQCVSDLKQALLKQGIQVVGDCQTIIAKSNKSRIILYTHTSPTLEKIVYYTNSKSNNLYAEQLLRAIAVNKVGVGDMQKGIEEIKKYWQQKGLDIAGLFMSDGSGLSRFNGVTAQQLTSILLLAEKEPYFNQLYGSFLIAGVSTTFGDNTSLENKMVAKSGYMTRVRSYAGYIKNKQGQTVAFALVANNYSCSATSMKHKMERLLTSLVE